MDYNSFYATASKHYNFSRLDEGDVFDYTLHYICNQLENKNLSILDVGCGTGEYGFSLKQKGYKVVGIDKSYEQVKVASRRIPAFQGDILSLEQKSNSFDVVLLIMMIHQLDINELNNAFQEITRVLKPNGIVIIKTCFEEEIRDRFTSRYFPSCFDIDMKRFPSLENIVAATPKLKIIANDKVSIQFKIKKELLIEKFRLRGASNIGMISEHELQQGIKQIIRDYESSDIIEMNMDNCFLVLKKIS